MISAKLKVERYVKKQRRPWFEVLSKTGDLRVETITKRMFTTRRRPSEGQELTSLKLSTDVSAKETELHNP